MKRLWLVLGPLAVVLAAVGCAADRDETVITFNGGEMTLADLEAEFARRGPETVASADRDSVLLEFANGLVDKLVMSYDAKRQPRGDTTGLARSLAMTRQRKIVELMKNEQVNDLDLSSERLDQAYARMGEEVRAAHILCATRTEADSLLSEIRAGADFADLAKARSKDAFSAKNGGDLGWFTFGTYAGIDNTAYELEVGEVSEPIWTRRGWHLVKLLERRPRDRSATEGNFAYFERNFRDRLMSQRWNEHCAILWEQRGMTWSQDGLDLAVAALEDYNGRHARKKAEADSILAAGGTLDASFTSFPSGPEPTDEERSRIIVSGQGYSFTLGDFADAMAVTPLALRPRTVPDTTVQSWVWGKVAEDLATQDAERNGFLDDPARARAVSDAVEFSLVERLYNHEVVNKAEPTEDEVRAYFDARRDLFYWRPDLDLCLFRTGDVSVANRIVDALKAGTPASVVQSDFSADPSLEVTLHTGLKREFPEYENLTEVVRALGDTLGAVTDAMPLAGKFTVARIEDKGDVQLMTFEEAYQYAYPGCRAERREARMRTFLDSLRVANGAVIDTTVLRQARIGSR